MPGRTPFYGLQSQSNTTYGGTYELFANERQLSGYNADIVKKMTAYMQAEDHVLEFGAGIGTLAVEWRRQTSRAPDCVEVDPDQRRFIQARGFVCHASVGGFTEAYDMIYTSNVLEHIEDDTSALTQLHSALRRDGVVAIFVPAFMCLFSDADRAVGHYRRYQRKELLEKVQAAGFTIIDCYFVDSIGFFAWLGTRILGYKKGESLGNDGSLMFYDKCLYPLSKSLDRLGLRHVFGKNLLVAARKQSL